MSTATCPLCGEAYLAVATVCADCRVALVPDRPEPVEGSADAGGPTDVSGDDDEPADVRAAGTGRATAAAAGDGPEAGPAWPEGDEEIGYDLDDWGPDDRDALTAALRAERIAHEWRDDEVVVPERWADVAEELIDAIDHPDALDPEDEADDGGAELLGALYVASDVLSGDPSSSGAVIELLELAPTMVGRAAPYGLEGSTWRAVGERVAELAALLDADADEEEVRPVAAALRSLLRDLV